MEGGGGQLSGGRAAPYGVATGIILFVKEEEVVLVYGDGYVVVMSGIWVYLYWFDYENNMKKEEVLQLQLNQYQPLQKKELYYMVLLSSYDGIIIEMNIYYVLAVLIHASARV